jgi:hypothetical protein
MNAKRSETMRGFDSRVQSGLGEQLRLLFRETAMEPIPPRFLRLLDRLESSAAEFSAVEQGFAPSPSSSEVRI